MYSEAEFFTATCLNWQHLLRFDQRKDIIIDSLRYLVNDNRMWIYGFVIMPNHIHIVWSKRDDWQEKNVEQMFLKYTAQRFKFNLIDSSQLQELELYKSTQSDRNYHIWERRPWKAHLADRKTIAQKLNYIHLNPVNKGLCDKEEDYLYSSCAFYYNNDTRWEFLTNYIEHY